MTAPARLLRVELTYAVFGLGVKNGTVVQAAPIAKWTLGKPVASALTYWKQKKQLQSAKYTDEKD